MDESSGQAESLKLLVDLLDSVGFDYMLTGSIAAKIDAIIRDPRRDPDETLKRRRSTEWSDREVKVIGPEDLIIAKLEWARESESEMQLRDVRYLLHHGELDEPYLRRRAARLGLTPLLKRAQDG